MYSPGPIVCYTNNTTDKIIFKNRGIKYRSADQMTDIELNNLSKRRYGLFRIGNKMIIAINPKRAMQTYKRIQFI